MWVNLAIHDFISFWGIPSRNLLILHASVTTAEKEKVFEYVKRLKPVLSSVIAEIIATSVLLFYGWNGNDEDYHDNGMATTKTITTTEWIFLRILRCRFRSMAYEYRVLFLYIKTISGILKISY